MRYRFKRIHLPTKTETYGFVERDSMREGIYIFNADRFVELLARWNQIAAMQPILQWEYHAACVLEPCSGSNW